MAVMRSEYLKEKILEFSVKALISEGLFLCRKEDISNMAELSRPIDKEFNVEVEGGRFSTEFLMIW